MGQDTDHWTRVAADWITWARAPGHDAFWAFREAFATFVGPGEGDALDIGCGEGRQSRLLGELGYRTTACDPVPALLDAARAAGSAADYHLVSATELPFDDGSFDLTLLYNCLMDIEDAETALAEAGRVTAAGGRVVISIVHPIADLELAFRSEDEQDIDYFESSPFDAATEEEGLSMHFAGWARPLSYYTDAILDGGLRVHRIAEPRASADPAHHRQARWRRLPLFLWIDARTPMS